MSENEDKYKLRKAFNQLVKGCHMRIKSINNCPYWLYKLLRKFKTNFEKSIHQVERK
ncbi:hypothetical protein [Clostridium sp. JS66]|uniref:hypothetical protein n=1 Tax=Clostridium sp. JS66 TaxID=3064705 RepID=UPI00298E37ED|nr:hypothetical protein [Clostridium sp. JS66]WPC42375.1 hypothetical protein Q6H37_02620 [Clostridium sp. JS66]